MRNPLGKVSACGLSCWSRFLALENHWYCVYSHRRLTVYCCQPRKCHTHHINTRSRLLSCLDKSLVPMQVIQAIRKRDALFRKTKKCKSLAVHQKFRAARNRVTALIRLNKTKFFQSLRTSDTKNFWKAIKQKAEINLNYLMHSQPHYG